MKKRILSILLAVLMLVSVLPISALAAEPATDPDLEASIKISTDPGPKIVKSAKWVDKEKGIAEITFKVTGEQAETNEQKLDIVLVIDKSISMGYYVDRNITRLDCAKTAAKKFVSSIVKANDQSVKVAVVTYAGNAKLLQNFSNNANTINDKINGISIASGTNIQAGIHLGQATLTSKRARSDAKKIMIVLTDGDPNYALAKKNRAQPSEVSAEDAQKYHIITSDYDRLYSVDQFKEENTSDPENTECARRAVSEALGAKKAGTTIYSIGFAIDSGSTADKTMRSVASADNKYVRAGESESSITSAFDEILADIKFKAYDVSLTDTMGEGFTIDESFTPTTNGGEVTTSGGGLTWNVADKLDEKEKNLTFRVKYNTENPSDEDLLKTNGSTELKYAEEENGTADKTVGVDSPKLPNLARTLTYKDGYSANGTAGLKDAHAQVRAWYGTEVTVTDLEPTRDGYVFKKWDNAAANDKIKLTDNVTLTAEWDDDTTTVEYKITKEWDGRVGDSATFQIKCDGANYREVTLTAADAPNNDNVWETTVNVPKWTQPNAQGVKTESKYTVVETKINGIDLVNGRVEEKNSDNLVTGTWRSNATATGAINTFEGAPTYGVTYVYESGTAGKDLPAEISTATGSYAVADNTQYYVGQSVANNGLAAGTKYTMSDGSGEWVLSWDKTSDTMKAEGVTFTGTWTFKPNSMVTLRYEIVVKDAGAPQPKYGTVTKPDDQTGYSGTDFNVAGSATTTDDTYTWTFHGWYTDDACSNPAGASINLTGDTTLYGYWTSVAIVGDYKVTEYYMQADGTYDGGTVAKSGTHALGEWTYTPDATKPGGYTLNETESDLTKIITADGTAEFKVYYDLSSGSKVTKVAKVSGNVTDHAEVGDTIDYYITVSNEGGLDLTDLTLTDTFNRADLHFDEGEGYTVTPVEGEEGKWTITIPSLTVAEGSITIRATYKVVDTDSGRTLRNTVGGTGDDTEGGSTVTVGEVTHNNVVIDIEKTVTSKRGTAPREGYVFVAYYVDESENEHELGRTTIHMSESATKDDPKTETGKIRFTLSEEEYAMLPQEKVSEDGEEEAGVPYLYVRELPGEDAFTEYDSTVLKGYVIPAPVAYSILPEEPTYKEVEYIVAPETNLFGSVFAFENIYKKSTSRVDPIKVGPQLNRDDHVAYIMGYPDGRVRPEGEITRAEACTIFFRLLTEESRDYYFTKVNNYTDVARGDWFNNAISTLSNAGIVTGYNDGTFRPNQPITRGEMAKIIANFANLKYGGKTFTDLAGHWSKSYVELAAGNGWIAGYPDGSFRPDQKITRAETVTMINRVLDRVPAKESRLLSRSIMLTFPDNNPGDWYYIAIQEASNSHEYQRSVYETTGDEMWTKLIDNVDWTKLEK